MNVTEFIRECETNFGSGRVRLMPNQQATYIEKLQQFSPDQLSAIYNKVLELTEHFPKIKNIYDAARDLGYLQTESDLFRPHRWQETDCRMCKGEGRICVTWIVCGEVQGGRRVEAHALNQIRNYSESCDSENFHLAKDEYRSLFRCSCAAGDAPDLPKAWPKWSRSTPGVFYR